MSKICHTLAKGDDIGGYYYLHTNGDLIHKRALPGWEDDCLESDFVVHAWPIHEIITKPEQWVVLIEAWKLGGNRERILGLMDHWGMDNEDGVEFLNRFNKNIPAYSKIRYKIDKDKIYTWWHCAPKDFVSGKHFVEAISNLIVTPT